MKLLKAAFLASMIPFATQAATLEDNSKLLVLGDSLSDPGNAASFGFAPNPLAYPEGQFTNGKTWAVQLGADLESQGNIAIGGARARDNGDAVPDLLLQTQALVGAILSGFDIGEDPFTAIWIGGNDLRDALVNPAQADDIIDKAIDAIETSLDILIGNGLTEFLVLGAPNLSLLPSVFGTPLQGFASDKSMEFNEELQNAIKERSAVAQIEYFDTFGFLTELYDNPEKYGFRIVDEPCLTETSFCGLENANDYLFFDGIHPSERAHTLLVEALTAGPAVVPLPASLPLALGALAGLGAIATRRTGRRAT